MAVITFDVLIYGEDCRSFLVKANVVLIDRKQEKEEHLFYCSDKANKSSVG